MQTKFPRTRKDAYSAHPEQVMEHWLKYSAKLPVSGFTIYRMPPGITLPCGCSSLERVMAGTLSLELRDQLRKRQFVATLVDMGGDFQIAVHASGVYNCCHCLSSWKTPDDMRRG